MILDKHANLKYKLRQHRQIKRTHSSEDIREQRNSLVEDFFKSLKIRERVQRNDNALDRLSVKEVEGFQAGLKHGVLEIYHP